MCKQFGIAVIRGVIVIANFILLITSVVLMYRTGILYTQYKSYEIVFDPSLQTQPLASMVLGVLVGAFSLFGFFAICLNALGMTVFFIIFLLLFGIVFTAFGAIVLSESTDMYTDDKYFINLMDRSPNLTYDAEKMVGVENVQRDLLCCGFSSRGPDSYFNVNQPLPQSCCKDPEHTCLYDDIWDTDCLSQIELFGVVTHTEIAALMLCIAAQCLIVAAIGYVFAMAIRQYYYY